MVARANAARRRADRRGAGADGADADCCQARDRAVPVLADARPSATGASRAPPATSAHFRASPEFDEAILALGAGLRHDMKLGQGPRTDLLIVGASATDYVGHSLRHRRRGDVHSDGHSRPDARQILRGARQDRRRLCRRADRRSWRPRPARTQPRACRARWRRASTRHCSASVLGKAIAAKLGHRRGRCWSAASAGDVWYRSEADQAQRAAVRGRGDPPLFARIRRSQAVFTRAQIAATAAPKGPARDLDAARARARIVRPRSVRATCSSPSSHAITPIAAPGPRHVATHGSIWDYDRRVPILFWRKGMTGFEQPLSVETVDIAPTLAALIGMCRCRCRSTGAASIWMRERGRPADKTPSPFGRGNLAPLERAHS